MINILLCDDDAKIRLEIERQICNQITFQQYDMAIALSCESPVTLLDELKRMEKKCNIYFLDVDLKHCEYDGFLLGKRIRELDPSGTIIYITSFGDLAYKTFQYHIEAFDYIVKDKPEEMAVSISRCLLSIVERRAKEDTSLSSYYTFRTQDMIQHIPIMDIYFFETSAKAHFIVLHGKYQRIEFLSNLSEIEEELNEHFIRIHRSYLIAVDKIEKIDLKRSEVIIGGECLKISRKCKSKLLERISQ